MSTVEDHRFKQIDFTCIYDCPSIGAGPSLTLFHKGESSDKVLFWIQGCHQASHMAAAQ